jgi:hypothetical protein
MSVTTTEACQCPRCRAHAAGLGPGPYTPAEYALIAPPDIATPSDDPVSRDPDVRAAEQARDDARAVFDAVDAEWARAVAEHRSAQLLGRDDLYVVGRQPPSRDPRTAALAEAEKEARERRDRAWVAIVKANDKIRSAQWQATVAAARNGKRKGRR